MVTMTLAQWRALVDYLGNVTFDDRDTLEFASLPDGVVRARVLGRGVHLVDEVEVGLEGE